MVRYDDYVLKEEWVEDILAYRQLPDEAVGSIRTQRRWRDTERLERSCGIKREYDGVWMPREILMINALYYFWWYGVLPVIGEIQMSMDEERYKVTWP